MLDIFKYLNMKNLLNASQVSMQFERLAISTFSTKYKHFKLDNRNCTTTDSNLITTFKTFGSVMQSIETPKRIYLLYERDKNLY